MSDDDVRKIFQRVSVEEITALIEQRPDLVNQDFGEGRSRCNALTLAVRRNDPEIFRVLVEHGAKPMRDPESKHHLLATFLSSTRYDSSPSLDILSGIFELGETFPEHTDEKNCNGLVRYWMSNIYAYDNANLLNAMIDLGFDPVATETAAKSSMIVGSLSNSSTRSCNIARVLLDSGCTVQPQAADHYSALGRAIELNAYKFVSRLLDQGARPSRNECIPVMLADHPGMPAELIERLTENQDLDAADQYGSTPLFAAIAFNNPEYASYLVEKGVDVNRYSKLGGPLFYAIECNEKEMIKHLVSLGADVNAKNGKGDTVLDVTKSLPGFTRLSAALVKAGAKTSLELAGGLNDETAVRGSIEKAIQPGEVWANMARKALEQLELDQAVAWDTLIRHCLDNNSSKPSKKWLTGASALLDEIGERSFRECLLSWLPLVREKRVGKLEMGPDDYYEYDTSYSISENNTRLLKGLLWLSSRFDDAETTRTLRELATQMYKKVYGKGMRNAKLANAAIYSLSVMPNGAGLKDIIVLRAATKYNPALVHINKVFDKLAEDSGKTPDELAEQFVPDYGLTGIGEYRQAVGDFEAVVNLVAVGKCELLWSRDGKSQKSVPASIKDEFSEDIKAIKGLIKDVQTGCTAHNQRLEKLYLRGESLDPATWKEQYIDHRLIGFLARRLIWRIRAGDDCNDVIFTPQGYIDHEGKTIEVPADAAIDLWHPSMSSAAEVLAWRNFLIEREITQPFKQAHREIYLLTDAERETRHYSLRFANHILKHIQFHALATQRGWRQQRGGHWDGGQENDASKYFPAYKLRVDFDAEGVESYDYTDSGIYQCVATGQVRFSKKQPVDLATVDPLLFSEAMRDIDLFVSVTSIGNDPDWRERRDEYWSDYSFGELNETAKTRKEVLEAIIPKLKIAAQLKIDGRYLVVEGKLRTYKIHIGSSNILMLPNDSYLCIVSTRSKADVMLPFEGDQTLSQILSKAVMLANDTKIRDQTILSQINSEISEQGEDD